MWQIKVSTEYCEKKKVFNQHLSEKVIKSLSMQVEQRWPEMIKGKQYFILKTNSWIT